MIMAYGGCCTSGILAVLVYWSCGYNDPHNKFALRKIMFKISPVTEEDEDKHRYRDFNFKIKIMTKKSWSTRTWTRTRI